jgi:D-arabinose 1-dehydrogenase-like Zn-dependent alcohol dehydrogenase
MSAKPTSMRAVILKDEYKVSVEERPLPVIETDGDVIVKVHLAGLCGAFLFGTIHSGTLPKTQNVMADAAGVRR